MNAVSVMAEATVHMNESNNVQLVATYACPLYRVLWREDVMRSGVVDVAAPTQSGMPLPTSYRRSPKHRLNILCVYNDSAYLTKPWATPQPWSIPPWVMLGGPLYCSGVAGQNCQSDKCKAKRDLAWLPRFVPIAKASDKLKNDRGTSALTL